MGVFWCWGWGGGVVGGFLGGGVFGGVGLGGVGGGFKTYRHRDKRGKTGVPQGRHKHFGLFWGRRSSKALTETKATVAKRKNTMKNTSLPPTRRKASGIRGESRLTSDKNGEEKAASVK